VARWQGYDFQERIALLDLGPSTVYACLSQDQKLVAAGSTNGAIAVWDLHRRVQVGGGTTGSIFPITFCDEDKRLITLAPGEHQVSEWDLTTWRKIRSWGLPGVHPGFLSPDQKWRIALDDEGRALIGDMATGREIPADLQIRQTRDAVFSADNKLLAFASDLGFARLFDFAGNPPRPIATLSGFMLGVDSVAFSADGKRLATSSAGKEAIKLWDVESQRELLTLEADGGMCFEAKFSPDGNILGTYTDTGKIELWRAPSWPEIEAAEAALAHNGGER
jgi:WD40 repeat protein